jgi:osmoprotectant transport system ATP-binding protein
MIQLVDVCKTFNGIDMVVENLNLEIKHGELVVLVGESGCGKTTTMKMINRLEEVSSGTIMIDGKDIKEADPIELRRNIGYVIQQVGLFPHLTVGQNIGVVPRLTKNDPAKIAKKND